ncbi:hypothetical protein QRO08_22635 [Paracidovorax citrulli]|uniref:Uncharacterized protein n=2 Tax=Paracidovorax citrulli TaxID=80869 RepID=A1TJC9_PARC0|nr:hypothetical protein [Paracidovorax citrulli]ABM31067.1 hypothetical protein Aave_0460 [Paracidovorax citrulli AAC00-1]ACU00250.1 hypothetical protein [Paracidovorax citrulli]ATG95783.1 hypothetical protein CQB05_18540 [Paracidovorax citrulli]MVT29634.1 hypothetical protein [Paracidovorax citrulli]PVY65248.1 hypothetical protein C8E08_2601 [Paracidovorax citrulli]
MNAPLDLSNHSPVPAQEFEASPALQALVCDAALVLGASAGQAQEAARTGRLELERHTVAVTADAGEETLLLSVDLGPSYLAEPGRAQAALVANMHLFVKAGVTFARGLAGPVLVGRWPAADAPALANGVRQMGAIAQGFQVPGSSGASPSPSQPLRGASEPQE